jgi:hypothetical protein
MKKITLLLCTAVLSATAYAQNVGIGTSSPHTTLEVSADVNDLLKLTSTTGGLGNHAYIDFLTYAGTSIDGRIGTIDMGSYNGSLVFETGNAGVANTTTIERMRILNNGNVGIGTTNPAGLFTVGSGTASPFMINSSGTITAATGITSSGTIQFSGLLGSSSGSLVAASSTGVLSVAGTSTTLPITAGTGITIGSANTINSYWTLNGSNNLYNNNSGGYVGIGMNAPASPLHIFTPTGYGIALDAAAGGQALMFYNGGSATASGTQKAAMALAGFSGNWSTDAVSNDLVIRSSSSQKILLNTNGGNSSSTLAVSGGSVGIGTTNPATYLQLGNTSNSASSYQTFAAGNGTQLRTWQMGIPYSSSVFTAPYFGFVITDLSAGTGLTATNTPL